MPDEQTIPAATEVTYKDDDLVYVDPKERKVVGLVEWTKAGNPKALPMQEMEDVEEDEPVAESAQPAADAKAKPRRRARRQRYYPWGTYRSMKKIYKLEGKQHPPEHRYTLDQVIEKALTEPFWD